MHFFLFQVNGCDVTDLYCEKTDISQNLKTQDHIKSLGLIPLVEGGFYKETYRSDHLSVIYFLLPLGTFSVWHRVLNSDEVWSFHEGCPLAMHLIYRNGTYERIILGVDGYSVTIPRNTLQAEEPIGDCHSLVGNVVSPPFDWQNFEMPSFKQLIDRFPQHEEIFKQFTRHQGTYEIIL